MRKVPSCVASAGLLLLLAACGDQATTAGNVSVLVSGPTSTGMLSLMNGRLEVVGDCLGANGSVIVWPPGTDVVKQDPLTIDIPDNGTFTLGDDVHLGGGLVVQHPIDDVEPGPIEVAGVSVPAECAKHDIFLAH
jgi:hypothetical protein